MTNHDKIFGFLPFALIIIVGSFSFVGGYIVGRDTTLAKNATVMQRDTICIPDTSHHEHPKPNESRDSIIYVPVPVEVPGKNDTIYMPDTIYVPMKFETKIYEDEKYRAQVSGFSPSLDFIDIYSQTKVVNSTIYIEPPKWQLNGLAGIRIDRFGTTAFAGADLGYTHNRWNFSVQGGGMMDYRGVSWFGQGVVKYDLIGK